MLLPGQRLSLILLLVLGGTAAADLWWPEPDFAPAQAADAPAWLTGQKLCFSRWDGGPIEACKGFLSGWTYFNPPWPSVVDATVRWYDPETAELAGRMGYNFIWVTFSNGFSAETERIQWKQIGRYVDKCHARGIRVAAYMSSTNMFVDDMFLRVPESREWLMLDDKGQPVPYGAAAYDKMGRTTRQLADLSRPEWRAYIKGRIDAALEAGCDGIEFDNSFFSVGGDERSQKRYAEYQSKNGFTDTPDVKLFYEQEQIRRAFREFLDYARRRKPDAVLFCNAHWGNLHISRSNTIISTEDGAEPGYYSPEGTIEYVRGEKDELIEPIYEDLPPITTPPEPVAEHFHTNLALLRGLHGMSDGWKPVLVEFGGRRSGGRFVNQMPPLAFQLAVGECNAALCSLQGFQEGRPLLDLFERRPEMMQIVEAAAQAHGFVREHAELVLGARSKADVAIILDDRMRGRALLERLARRNVQFDVLYDWDVRPERLARYQRILAMDCKLISGEACSALVSYANSGGPFRVVGESGAADQWGQPRTNNPLDAWKTEPAGTSEDALVAFLVDGIEPTFTVVDNPYILFTVTEPKSAAGTTVVHLMNYLKHPVEDVRVHCPAAQEMQLFALTPGCDRILEGIEPQEWVIPKLGVYSMIVIR